MTVSASMVPIEVNDQLALVLVVLDTLHHRRSRTCGSAWGPGRTDADLFTGRGELRDGCRPRRTRPRSRCAPRLDLLDSWRLWLETTSVQRPLRRLMMVADLVGHARGSETRPLGSRGRSPGSGAPAQAGRFALTVRGRAAAEVPPPCRLTSSGTSRLRLDAIRRDVLGLRHVHQTRRPCPRAGAARLAGRHPMRRQAPIPPPAVGA